MTVDKMQFIMKHNLDKVKKQYDFIIIDCPPALRMLTINAMTAANTCSFQFNVNIMHWKDLLS